MLDREERRSYCRILEAFAQPKETVGHDLLVKAVNNIDTVLFHGRLLDRVVVSWEEVEATATDRTRRTAATYYPRAGAGSPRVVIELDIYWVWRKPKFDIWGSLIHEMLHAYLAITTGDDRGLYIKEECDCGGLTYHGTMFRNTSRELARCLEVAGFTERNIFSDAVG